MLRRADASPRTSRTRGARQLVRADAGAAHHVPRDRHHRQRADRLRGRPGSRRAQAEPGARAARCTSAHVRTRRGRRGRIRRQSEFRRSRSEGTRQAASNKTPADEAASTSDREPRAAPRPPGPLRLHPGALRRVLALAEGRRAVHRRSPRRGRVPDRRGAGAAGQHVLEHGRALLAGARLRGLPRAPAGGPRRVPPRGRRANGGRRSPRPRRCSRSTTPSSRRRWPPTTSTSRTPRTSSRAPTSRRRSTRSCPPRRC